MFIKELGNQTGLHHHQTGLHHEQREVGPLPSSEIHLSGDGIRHDIPLSPPSPTADPIPPGRVESTQIQSDSHCQTTHETFGKHGVHGPSPPPRQSSQKTTPQKIERSLQPGIRQLEQGAATTTIVYQPNSPVGKLFMTQYPSTDHDSRANSHNIHQCLQEGLSRPHGNHPIGGSLASDPSKTTHKQTKLEIVHRTL